MNETSHCPENIRATRPFIAPASAGHEIQRIVPVGAKQNGFELAGKGPSEHIAPYPEELIKPYIKSLTPIGGTVLDPFLGSGTSMRVAMEQGLNCIGIELNGASMAYAKKRLNWGSGLDVEYSEVNE